MSTHQTLTPSAWPRPYWSVIFVSQRNEADATGYGAAAQHMVDLASQQPGYLGVDSVRDGTGQGITVSYWASLEAIAAWRRHLAHAATRDHGRAHWYRAYTLHVARVDHAYSWDAERDGPADPMRAATHHTPTGAP